MPDGATSHGAQPASALPANALPEAGTGRPRSVRLAILFALGAAVAGAGQSINAFAEKRTLASGLVAVGTSIDPQLVIYRTTDLRGSVSLAIVLGACALVLFAPVSLLIARRVRRTRMLAWIVGIALIGGEAVLMAADGAAVKTGKFVTDADVPGGQADLVARLNHTLVPGWFPPVHYLTEFLVLSCLIGACVQLARSADYFRPEEAPVTEDARVWSTARNRASRDSG